LVLSCQPSSRTALPGDTDRGPPGCAQCQRLYGAIIRGDTARKNISLVFTGDEYADGGEHILAVLQRQQIQGSFFLTGRFYRNPRFAPLIGKLRSHGHYLGAHSDRHLLYCDWEQRDALLVSRDEFTEDLETNYRAMSAFGVAREDAPYFLPPYEWYNDTISAWTSSMELQLVNYTPGTLSHADYTVPDEPGYRSSETIFHSIMAYERAQARGLNGFILLSHVGTAPERTDKFYVLLEELIMELKALGYRFCRIDALLADASEVACGAPQIADR
jgi:peptidoglycan/xylan/chitin deacetylase (PgdA/CDA1 family)